jgi:hypothetical protein
MFITNYCQLALTISQGTPNRGVLDYIKANLGMGAVSKQREGARLRSKLVSFTLKGNGSGPTRLLRSARRSKNRGSEFAELATLTFAQSKSKRCSATL